MNIEFARQIRKMLYQSHSANSESIDDEALLEEYWQKAVWEAERICQTCNLDHIAFICLGRACLCNWKDSNSPTWRMMDRYLRNQLPDYATEPLIDLYLKNKVLIYLCTAAAFNWEDPLCEEWREIRDYLGG